MSDAEALGDFELEQQLRERAADDYDAELAVERLDGHVRVAFRHYTDPLAQATGGVTDLKSAQAADRRRAMLALLASLTQR